MNMHMQLVIRPSTCSDVELAATLIYSSMGELAEYLFGGVQLSAEEILEGLFLLNDNRFSWQKTDVAEWEGNPAGILISFAGREFTRRELSIGLGLLRLCGVMSVMRLSMRALSVANGIETLKDEYYLAHIAVLPGYQGRGIGSSLLKYAETKARKAGQGKCSLIVDLENPDAQRLYERWGYQIVYSKEYPGPARDAHAGYHRMVKVLN
jgi:ribosomal protein S18 acetylase RimI-like enzyme